MTKSGFLTAALHNPTADMGFLFRIVHGKEAGDSIPALYKKVSLFYHQKTEQQSLGILLHAGMKIRFPPEVLTIS